jgi:hypothetical protein
MCKWSHWWWLVLLAFNYSTDSNVTESSVSPLYRSHYQYIHIKTKFIIPGHRGGIGSYRIWIFLSDPIRFLSDSFRSESCPDFIGIRRNPLKSGSDPIGFLWKMSDSDEIRHGSDRKQSDLQVGSLDLGYNSPVSSKMSRRKKAFFSLFV